MASTMIDPKTADRLVRWGFPLATFAFFAATAYGYGVFRDELYYIACSRHIDWGTWITRLWSR